MKLTRKPSKETGRKVVQQHSLTPDPLSRGAGSETPGRITPENLQLRDAINRQASELEQKKRELEIEASLEKVRVKAMGMKQPGDMLEICQAISEQLELLNVKDIRNVQTAIFYESTSTYLNFEYYTRHDKLLITEVDYKSHELQAVFADQMLNGAGELFARTLKGQKLKDWYAYQKTTNQFVDVYLETARSLSYYWYSLGPVALGMSTYSPLSESGIELFKRFRNVFELAYRRFMDIEKALAQAVRAESDLVKLQVEKKRTEDALKELKAAQAQLIQAEKMATLGELTAGIAHEIQNPLNFVNNFSEVTAEMIRELEVEIEKGNKNEIMLLLDDVRQNLEKINFHGKRASSIVKGMLEHSRASTGQKELIDLNTLADEYLRLAYHGLRAKDKSFNAVFKTEFDGSLPRVSVIPQDISRVLLNLINNAFYAVSEKTRQGHEAYIPTVKVSTKRESNSVLVKVEDNGNGIPKDAFDRIFQPFFTTKPAGEGTGLGLSLSYDIVKAHGGELTVETKEGEGTAFIITLKI